MLISTDDEGKRTTSPSFSMVDPKQSWEIDSLRQTYR
jgi:hypothetical protein